MGQSTFFWEYHVILLSTICILVGDGFIFNLMVGRVPNGKYSPSHSVATVQNFYQTNRLLRQYLGSPLACSELPVAGSNTTSSFLRKMGITNAKVLRHAREKRIQVEADLKPLLRYLETELGLVDIVSLLDQCPQLVTRHPEKDLAPAVELLNNLYGSKMAREAVQRNPFLLCVKVRQKQATPASVYLESLGIPTGGIHDKSPHLLSLSVNESIIPVWNYLFGIIENAEDTRTAIRKFPNLLGLSVDDKLKKTIDFLQEIGITKLDKMLVRCPSLLGLSLEENIKPTVAYLEDIGLNLACGCLDRHPALLMLSLESNLKPKVQYFKQIGVKDVSRLFQHPNIFSLRLDSLKDKVNFLESLGMDIPKQIEKYPHLLALSLKDNLVPKTQFLSSIGYTSSEFTGRQLLASLEQRISPRSYYIKEKGDSFPSLNVLAIYTDKEFCKSMGYSLDDFIEAANVVTNQLKQQKMLRLWIEDNVPMS